MSAQNALFQSKKMTSPMQPNFNMEPRNRHIPISKKWKSSHGDIPSQHHSKSSFRQILQLFNQKSSSTVLNPIFGVPCDFPAPSLRLSRRQQCHASRPTPGGCRGNRLPGGGAAGATWAKMVADHQITSTMGKIWETHGKM